MTSGGRASAARRRAAAAAMLVAAAAAGPPQGYYEALGLRQGRATTAEVRAAFEAAKRRGDAPGIVDEAFRVLSDPDQRARHDALELDVWRHLGGAGAASTRTTAGASAKNFAQGRPTYQSSTRPGGGESSRAVDGKADPHWAAGSCSHTAPEGEARPWWSVDLGVPHAVGRVRLLNRQEASERLANWQVFAGTVSGRPDSDPATWRGAAPCGDLVAGPAGAGQWVEADCGGRVVRHVGVVLAGGAAGKAILTLCEVEVLEHIRVARDGYVSAARRYVEDYLVALASAASHRRPHYLQRAAELLGQVLDAVPPEDVAGLERLYREASELPTPSGPMALERGGASSTAVASASPEVLLVRARALERLALSPACQLDPTSCCTPALTRSAAGCLATAVALAKLAGDVQRARELYELSVSGRPAGRDGEAAISPVAEWPSFWQACELYVPERKGSSASFGPFWDPEEPALHPLGSLMQGKELAAALAADIETLNRLQGNGRLASPAFKPSYAALVEAGGWERLVLYSGIGGWDQRWCGPAASPRLRLCDELAGRLPGEEDQLQTYYLLDNNEEVSLSRLLAPKTHLRPHNGGTNARMNFDLVLGAGKTSVRVGWQRRSVSAGGDLLVYDACYDRDITHEGDRPLYILQVGAMHPNFLLDIQARRARGEL